MNDGEIMGHDIWNHKDTFVLDQNGNKFEPIYSAYKLFMHGRLPSRTGKHTQTYDVPLP